MPRFSDERKEAILNRLLPPYNMTVSSLAKMEGISEATLYNWRKQARLRGRAVPGPKLNHTDQWSAEAKLATVIETASLSEARLTNIAVKRACLSSRSRAGKRHRWPDFKPVMIRTKH
jgi:transposase-like protein